MTKKTTRRPPTKSELERLQRLYKTDERIAERMGGGVAPYLVAYWRRKKNIPKFSAPKFSEKEIFDLWERFGDDYRCGADLGISKAAFYTWRRKYGISQKPAFLKLEQMELRFPGKEFETRETAQYGKLPAITKLWLSSDRHGAADRNNAVRISPDLVVIDRSFREVVSSFSEEDSQVVFNPSRIALGTSFAQGDFSDGSDPSGANAGEWAELQRIRLRVGMAEGSVWESLILSGSLLPGQQVICERGCERFAGAVGSLGIGMDSQKMSGILRDGYIDIQPPSVTNVILTGKRYTPVFATDIALYLASMLSHEKLSDVAIEYSGSAFSGMSIIDRQALCAIPALLNCKTALVPFDAVTRRRYAVLGDPPYHPVAPDRDAVYDSVCQLNIEQVIPMVAWKKPAGKSAKQDSNRPELKRTSDESCPKLEYLPVEELTQTAARVVFIGGSPGGHFDELARAAQIIRGKEIAGGVRLFVSPISRDAYLQGLRKGLLRKFVEAGAIVLNPGLDSTILGRFGIGPSATVVTTTIEPDFHLNASSASKYIMSPGAAAATALRGMITDPRGY
ncbi:MAG: hypothetical protein IIB00_05630 [candidate division Zixibacteria bacterium]|nr:hypothetical protein [candidate division Zixibacteria bacterium]